MAGEVIVGFPVSIGADLVIDGEVRGKVSATRVQRCRVSPDGPAGDVWWYEVTFGFEWSGFSGRRYAMGRGGELELLREVFGDFGKHLHTP